MKDTLKILFNEDLKTDAELIWRELKKNNILFKELLVDNKKDFIAGLESFKPDLIISDYSLPQFNGMQALVIRNEISPLTPFILVTGSNNETVAVDCMKAGADDYILKDNLSRLGQSVINALNKAKLLGEKSIAEEALHKSELRFQQISENFGEWVWEVDKNGLYTYSSPVVKEILGYEPEEIVSKKHFYDLFTAEAMDQFKQPAMDAFERKENIRSFINTNLRKDGSEVILSTSGFPLLDKDGNLTGYRGVDINVTELKRTERTLENIIDYNPMSIQILDTEGFTLKVNKAFIKLFGSVPPSDYSVFNDLQLKEKGFAELLERIKNCEVVQFPDMVFNPHDSIPELPDCLSWIKAIGFSLADSNGKPEKIVLMHENITERKLAEQELIKAKDKAEEGDRLKTAFLHNISHEIRTPMNAIVGFSALLGEPDLDAHSRTDYIEVIMQSSNHLLAIITDIIDISNIEANIVKIAKNEINVNSTLKTLCDQFLHVITGKNLQLVCENRVPDNGALIITDSTKLKQIITNLLSNAVKFTDKGSIKLGCEVKDKFLEFHVSDSGIGISEEHHNKIFDRFYQVQQSVSRLYEGTGLGLAISKANAEHMGGEMWLTSEPGKGTTFYFTIPYERQVGETPVVKDKTEPVYFVFPQKKKILVAEDIDSNFKLICYFLSGANIEVVSAVNGKEAVDKFFTIPDIDLILMDIKMPVMDGYTAAKLIREANISIPIIAQTAYADDIDKAIESGCSGLISKPFDRKGLLNKISEFIK
jgi:PAS domain S-box-containing protein